MVRGQRSHYRGMRSGTLPAPLLVGLGAACELAGREMEVQCMVSSLSESVCVCVQYDHAHVSAMSERLVKGLTSRLDHVVRNGDERETYPGLPPLYPIHPVQFPLIVPL